MLSLPQMGEEGLLTRMARAKISLIGANFFVETNRLEPLLAVYLIEFKNWDVLWVGYVSVAMNIIMLVFQTPAGDLMDKTHYKKLITAAAVLVGSITTAAVVWTSELYAVILIKTAEGIAATIYLPALMSLLLGVVPNADVPKLVSLTETSNKLGSVIFTVGTGFLSYYAYPDVSSIFYLLGIGGLCSAAFILLIPNDSIDDTRARAGVSEDAETTTKKGAEKESATALEEGRQDIENDVATDTGYTRYRDLLRDRKIVMFALLTFFYHLSNAAVLPLASQLMAQQDNRNGLAFTSGTLAIVYLVQAPTAYIVGTTHERFDYKNILMVGHLILPLRCAICALLAIYNPNQYALAAAQILEGLGAGIYDTLMPLVVRLLVDGTGRFGFTFGFIITCWRLGHGFSFLMAEAILKAAGGRYEVPFFVLGVGGLLVCFMLAFGVIIPAPTRLTTEEPNNNEAKSLSTTTASATDTEEPEYLRTSSQSYLFATSDSMQRMLSFHESRASLEASRKDSQSSLFLATARRMSSFRAPSTSLQAS